MGTCFKAQDRNSQQQERHIDAEHTFDKVLSWQLVVSLAVAGKDNFGHSVFVLDQPRAYK